jgi:uncharacterized protein HemY
MRAKLFVLAARCAKDLGDKTLAKQYLTRADREGSADQKQEIEALRALE